MHTKTQLVNVEYVHLNVKCYGTLVLHFMIQSLIHAEQLFLAFGFVQLHPSERGKA